jgi:hypothetical protein
LITDKSHHFSWRHGLCLDDEFSYVVTFCKHMTTVIFIDHLNNSNIFLCWCKHLDNSNIFLCWCKHLDNSNIFLYWYKHLDNSNIFLCWTLNMAGVIFIEHLDNSNIFLCWCKQLINDMAMEISYMYMNDRMIFYVWFDYSRKIFTLRIVNMLKLRERTVTFWHTDRK